MFTDLGDRIKKYEAVTSHVLVNKCPVIVRVDGKAFHTFTRNSERPFDKMLRDTMLHAAKATAAEMQGFKLAYHQSDEVTFLLSDLDTHQTEAWFGNQLAKMTSVAASLMTGHFNSEWYRVCEAQWGKKSWDAIPAFFDARVFNVPKQDVANCFLWRAKDWERNSITMYALAHFSHKELHGKGRADKHEMLHKIGKNWATDLEPHWRNGTFFTRDGAELHPDPVYEQIAALVDPLLEPKKEDEVQS